MDRGLTPPLPSTDSDSEPQSDGPRLQQEADLEVHPDISSWLHDMNPNVNELKTAVWFVNALQNVSLDNGGLDADALARLQSPPQRTFTIDDPSELFSLRQFATQRSSQQTYMDVRFT
jgi:hypothetical protein